MMHRLRTLSGSGRRPESCEIDARILRRKPEQAENRRLRARLEIQLFRGVLQIGVPQARSCFGSSCATAR